jgi:poly(A) polymerase
MNNSEFQIKPTSSSHPSMDLRQSCVLRSATLIVQTLRDNGFEAYFVGGFVRDLLLVEKEGGRQNAKAESAALPVETVIQTDCSNEIKHADIDIATSATPDDVERLFKRTVAVGKQFGVMIVVVRNVQFEVATFRSDGDYLDGRRPCAVHFSSAAEDVKRRDFTINGLLYDPIEEKVIDLVEGMADINKGIIRAIGEPQQRFKEDKLRILRAIRFSNRFNFPIEAVTSSAMNEYVAELEQVSMERIRDEFEKMLTGPDPEGALRMLDSYGILAAILPEVAALKGIEQNPEFHPEGDVFVHTMLMMKKLSYPSLVLSLACLLHDIGKPAVHEKETLRTPAHEHVGAVMAEKILRRLKFPTFIIEKVCWCVKNHMMFMHVQRMRVGKLKRLMSLDTFNMEMELHRIDCVCSHGMTDNYEFLIEKKAEFAAEDLKPKPILDGDDLIRLGFCPGPQFKDILDEARDLQLEHVLITKDDAIGWVKNNYGK